MTAPRAALRMERLSKAFPSPAGPVHVLKEIDLTVRPGEFVAVTGPSGSGKTTLMHLAALLDRPSGGRLYLEGEDVADAGEDRLCALRRERIGMVYQQFHLLPHRTALDNVLFRFRYITVDPASARRRAREALETMGLGDVADRPARLLSGGEMQRVAIARAVVVPPSILLADEPTGNLDGEAAARVVECLHRLHGDGLTVILATHNEDLAAIGHRRMRCEAGRIRDEDA